MPEPLAAATVWQPWATLIIEGWKPYEFRKWDYRDRRRDLVGKRIAIHAGARPARRDEIADLLDRLSRKHSMIAEAAAPFLERWHLSPGILPLSAVLGTAVLGEPLLAHTLLTSDQTAAAEADSMRVDHHMWAWPLTAIDDRHGD
ncbi:MAG: hypothetical protein WA709_06240 [Stellaceae bacterium]